MVAQTVLKDFHAFLKDVRNDASLGIVGDLCLDRFVFGSVERISPEAPVPVLHQERIDERLGCTANVCTNIAALNSRLPVHQYLFSVVGDDTLGHVLEKMLAGVGPSLTCELQRDPARPTTLKTRFLAGSQHQLLRVDDESARPLPAQISRALTKAVVERMSAFRVLILQDYAKGLLTPDFLQETLQEARSRGVFTLVDPHRRTPALAYKGASLIKPNVQEAEILLGENFSFEKGRDNARVEEGARRLRDRLDIPNVLITRSGHGMTLLPESGPARHFPALARSVFDVTGAGDTTIAILGAFLAAGAPLDLACAVSVAAASVVVAKVGTATASIEEIESELASL
jgi:D-beta-D-heptose 7-phosphate kinase / D-beta-D-heptose 1-phosphate adenosyltransferase